MLSYLVIQVKALVSGRCANFFLPILGKLSMEGLLVGNARNGCIQPKIRSVTLYVNIKIHLTIISESIMNFENNSPNY